MKAQARKTKAAKTNRVLFDAGPYRREHGSAPSGFGTWIFSTEPHPRIETKADVDALFRPIPLHLPDAKQLARDELNQRRAGLPVGTFTLYILP